MKVSANQLALPLFEPDASERAELRTRRQPTQPQPSPRVVSSRSQSRSGDAASAERAAGASAPALLTTHEAAEVLHVHPRTVQRLVERGELGAVRLGTAVRFDPLDLKVLTDRLKQHAPATAAVPSDRVRPSRGTTVSFAERLRSRQHEHRAAQA
jgi:excisionase family DNA binding protein